jgi:hypothetical protein
MRARLVVWALCAAIAVSQVGTVCPNPPVANQSIGQFISAPRALVASDSDTQKLEETTRRLAGTNAVLAANPVRFAEGTRGRFRTAVAACIAQVAIASGNVDRAVYATHRQSDEPCTNSISVTAAQRPSPIRWLV